MPRKSWWARLPFGVRMAAGTSALLIAVGGGAAGIAALTRDGAKPRIVTAVGDGAGDAAVPGTAAPEGPGPEQPPGNRVAVPARTSAVADPAASRNPARKPVTLGARAKAKAEPSPVAAATSPAASPVLTTRTQTETRAVPFATRTVSDPGLPSGSQQVQTPGVAGEQTLRYLVTLTNGKPTARRLVGKTVTRQPQPQVIAVGEKTDDCGGGLDICVPISRDSTCRHHWRDEDDQVGAGDDQVEQPTQVGQPAQVGQLAQVGQPAPDSDQAGESGSQIDVAGNDLTLLSGGPGDGHGGGGRGRYC